MWYNETILKLIVYSIYNETYVHIIWKNILKSTPPYIFY